MDLNILHERKKELEQALVNVSNSFQIITGHKQEVDHWISEFEKKLEEETKISNSIETEEALPVE